MRKTLVFLFIMQLCGIEHELYGQYKKVTALTGRQIIGKNSVNVSFTGHPPSFPGQYSCGFGPYEIGWFYGFFIQLWTPYSYKFAFDKQVNHVRVDVGGMWYPDIVQIIINGLPYTLTSADLRNIPNDCNWPMGIITGGMLTAPVGPPPRGIDNQYSGRLDIYYPAGIDSVEVFYAAPLLPNSMGGVNFNMYYTKIDAGNNGPVCAGTNLQLDGDSSLTEAGSFYWTGPNGFTSAEHHPIVPNLSANDTGVYTVVYVNGRDTLRDTTHVGLLPGPDQPVISANTNPACAGDMLTLNVTTPIGATAKWSGPNGLSSTDLTVSIPSVQEAHEGSYALTVTEYTCSLSDTEYVIVNHPVINKLAAVACSNEGYDFNGRHLTEPGTYRDSFMAANGCDSLSQLQLVILPSPEVVINPSVAGRLCMGDTIALSVSGADGYEWMNNNKAISSEEEFEYVLPELKSEIMAIGTGTNTCADTAYTIVDAEECCHMSMPTAFSPNDDGRNDMLGAIPGGNVIKGYHLEVFNRWGQQVFVSNHLGSKWDGMSQGMPAPMGTYFYSFSFECFTGKKMLQKGDVVLLR